MPYDDNGNLAQDDQPAKLPSWLRGLTKPGTALIDPQTQQPSFVGSPAQVLGKENQALGQTTIPDIQNRQIVPNNQPLPSAGQPTVVQATAPNPQTGMPTPALVNPGLSKLGKVVGLMVSGATGMLAGRAASEQMVAESGGRRSGGAGMGFTAATQLPFLRAAMQQGATRDQLENQASQQQLTQMATPVTMSDGTSMPMWKAMAMGKFKEVQASIAEKMSQANKNQFQTPRGGGVYNTTAGQYAPGAEPTPKTQTPEEEAMQSLTSKGVDPVAALGQVSQVKADAKPETGNDFERYYQGLTKQGTQDTPQNRKAAYADWVKNEPTYQAAQAGRQQANTQREDSANERSYQFHAARLDKLRQPVEQQLDRLSRLRDTLDQGTPQADALVAPELLTAMAGGQGSGLRMNEAEISRIVGGRNNWEDLKAKARAWQTDPNKGFALTPSQRQQVRALLEARTARLGQQQSILDQAGDGLVQAASPREHRAIYNRTQKALSGAMSGQQGGVQVTAPDGSMHTFPDQASADKFKSLAGIK